MRSIRFRRGGAVSIARAFEQLTNQRDRNAGALSLDTPELVSYVKEFNSEGSRMG